MQVKVRIWLSPELIDIDQPLAVTVDGKRVYKGSIEPDPVVLLEDLRLRGDRQHPFWAVVDTAAESAGR